jgi:nucleoside-diphosphate-sugar epimerase
MLKMPTDQLDIEVAHRDIGSEMVTYLVTGGAGFIGWHPREALLPRGNAVRVPDHSWTGRRENLPDDVELIASDVSDPSVLDHAVDGIADCFHLAAVASPRYTVEVDLRNDRT